MEMFAVIDAWRVLRGCRREIRQKVWPPGAWFAFPLLPHAGG